MTFAELVQAVGDTDIWSLNGVLVILFLRLFFH